MPSFVKNLVHWNIQKVQMPIQPPDDLCEICGIKPKFVEGGVKHPYCSRSCARNGGQGPSLSACALHSCRATGKPAFMGFCSEKHARDGVRAGQVKGCDSCQIQPRGAGNSLCIACERHSRSGPRMKELALDSQAFKTLRDHFTGSWSSREAASLSVEKVYEITASRDVRTRHDTYRTSHPVSEQIRVYHSSQCICDLGTKGPVLCDFRSCGICNVIKSSFKTLAFGVTCNNGRFGDGIYSYRNSSLADRFSTSCTTSPYRVMIACDVVIEPGQSPGGSQLSPNEESIFVASADAIIPRYVVMYIKH
ncbi:hypothetical protein BDN71DRAFT_1451765 [Pleurotus eryngii]|uniref:PARP catalytic domain-containing protein n=1 Tax=Pleurotus eryngii TaxID=5323 RepID=A0A9P5ZRT8_PLEER|nr:hypothetical protein BDN71DRAFT_1451765 [Pleurotus eryngii]